VKCLAVHKHPDICHLDTNPHFTNNHNDAIARIYTLHNKMKLRYICIQILIILPQIYSLREPDPNWHVYGDNVELTQSVNEELQSSQCICESYSDAILMNSFNTSLVDLPMILSTPQLFDVYCKTRLAEIQCKKRTCGAFITH
jgi:hypothetical protein